MHDYDVTKDIVQASTVSKDFTKTNSAKVHTITVDQKVPYHYVYDEDVNDVHNGLNDSFNYNANDHKEDYFHGNNENQEGDSNLRNDGTNLPKNVKVQEAVSMEDVVVNIENEEVTNQADVNIIKETNGVTLEKEENVNYYPNNNVVFNEGIVNEKIIEDVNDIVIF